MRRREFLKTSVIAAGAVGMVGCGDDKASQFPDDVPLSGRTLRDADAYAVETHFPQSVASGDPRDSSVVLWTRVADAGASGPALSLMLQVAEDEGLERRVPLGDAALLRAEASHDGCVRVRIEGLEPGAHYYYRFVYLPEAGGEAFASRIGRTKTAPAPDADVPARFAVCSCQDYGGRYYHAHRHMAEQPLDFVVHLGDYIYETAGDPSFQSTDGPRAVAFDDTAGALSLGEGEEAFLAAGSLDNYRQLYRLYRSDPDLQRVHERFPMIVIWDDHEYSDDCHGETATYLDGTEDERDAQRRANADQAWFEYMPVDYQDEAFQFEPSGFPGNLTIYRDFVYGKHLHLVMTDLRRYRDDHLVPEDAFPGAVPVRQAQLMAALGEVPDFAVPYVDLDEPAYAAHKAYLNSNAQALEMEQGDFAGVVDADFVNGLLARGPEEGRPAPIDTSGAERGISYALLFKTGRYSQIGSRYLTRTLPYEAFSQALFAASDGLGEQAMGQAQERWFIDTLKAATATWKVWGNEFVFMRRRVDLREVAQAAALGLQDLLSLSVEDWDGMPSRRARLLQEIGDIPNLVAVTGDIHAFFAGVERSAQDPGKALVEIVAGAISSFTYATGVLETAKRISPLAVGLAENLDALLTAANPHLAYLNTTHNGYAVLEAGPERLNATLFTIPDGAVVTAQLDGDLDAAFGAQRFFVKAGDKRLWREEAGAEQVWDDGAGGWS